MPTPALSPGLSLAEVVAECDGEASLGKGHSQGQTDIVQANHSDLGDVGLDFVKKLTLHRLLWGSQLKEKIGGQTAQIVCARPIFGSIKRGV